MQWDVFISHASEDKDAIARPLAERLTDAGVRVWLDEAELTLGDSLRAKIDEGLAHSRYGLVILSPAFFAKQWPQRELNGLAAREEAGRKVLLPVWHGVDRTTVVRHSPLLADLLAANTSDGIDAVVAQVVRALNVPPSGSRNRQRSAKTQPGKTVPKKEFSAVDFLLEVADTHRGKILGHPADKTSKLEDFLSANYSSYFQNAVERCSQVTTLFDRSTTLPLSSLYVRTYLSYAGSRVADRKLLELIATMPTNDVRTFVIIGTAGTGKTFLMRWLFLQLVQEQTRRIPFCIELRALNNHADVDLLSFVHKTVTDRRARVSEERFRAGLDDAEYIFLFDGLDEVQPRQREAVKTEIRRLQSAHPGVSFVVSTRPDEHVHSWDLVRPFTVLPLEKPQALSLISKLPYKKTVKARFREQVESELYEKHQSFLSNPLLINIMLLTYGDIGRVPSSMHIFYEQAYETLFFRHDTWKDVTYQRKHYCDLVVNEFRDLLSAFSVASYKRSRLEFTTANALDLIKAALGHERLSADPVAILNDMVESLCILQLDGLFYRFTHRSFQEYFAAVFIARGHVPNLRQLLDAIAVRRGDMVIPMAMEINRGLIEREWIIPRLAEILQSSGTDDGKVDLLRFANLIFGNVSYGGRRFVISGADVKQKNGTFVYALRDLYPNDIADWDSQMQLTDDDVAILRQRWEQMRDGLWANRDALPDRDLKASPPGVAVEIRGLWPSQRVILANALQAARQDSDRGFRQLMQSADNLFKSYLEKRFVLEPTDAGWFELTNAGRALLRLHRQLQELHSRLTRKLEETRATGLALLDDAFPSRNE